MFGSGSDGQLGLGSTTETELPRELSFGIAIKHVSCGYYHTALVTGEYVVVSVCIIGLIFIHWQWVWSDPCTLDIVGD